MQIITIVEGKIPINKTKEFEKYYAELKKEPFPEGLVRSSLLRNKNNPEIYRIQTVWQSLEILEKYRNSTETPTAILLFQKFGVTPKVEIYSVIYNLP